MIGLGTFGFSATENSRSSTSRFSRSFGRLSNLDCHWYLAPTGNFRQVEIGEYQGCGVDSGSWQDHAVRLSQVRTFLDGKNFRIPSTTWGAISIHVLWLQVRIKGPRQAPTRLLPSLNVLSLPGRSQRRWCEVAPFIDALS